MRGSFQPNEIFDHTYQIVREIGHGGSGVVYLAYHLRLQKYVVVKRLNVRMSNETLMRTEADALKNLHHPCLPQVYDYIVKAEGVYTVMDYIEGTDLQHIPCGAENLPESTLMAWLQQLAEVLDYLHTRNVQIIHSDIKPANILLRPDGTVCLIDFNISVGDDIGSMLKGVSPAYASPEQVAMAQTFLKGLPTTDQLDPRTDIYSLGATFYYLATGVAPDQNYQITPLSEMAGIGYSEPFCAIIDRCMAYDRGARYQTAAKLRSALTNPIRQSRMYRRYVAAWIAAVLITGSLAAAGAYCLIRGVQGQAYDAYRAEYVTFRQLVERGSDDAIIAGQRIIGNSRYDNVFAEHKEERPSILRAMGDLKFAVNDFESAASYYGDALEDAKKAGVESDDYYMNYIVALTNSGSLAKADRVLEEAETANVPMDDLHVLRAIVAQSRDDLDTAEREAQAAMDEARNDSSRSLACEVMGQVLIAKDDLAAAAEWLEKAERYESRPMTQRTLAGVYGALADQVSGDIAKRSYMQKEVTVYEQLYTKRAMTKVDYVNYCGTLNLLGQRATEKRMLQECRELYGDYFPALVMLASLEHEDGNDATARNLCEAASAAYESLSSSEQLSMGSYNHLLQLLKTVLALK